MTTITEEATEAVSRKKVLAIVENIRVSPQCSGSLADWICGVLAEEIKALPALVAPQAEGRDTGLPYAFITCNSEVDKFYVSIKTQTLHDAQRWHDAVLSLQGKP